MCSVPTALPLPLSPLLCPAAQHCQHPPQLVPSPSSPGSCHPHPLSASSPGSCSLIQLGRCNLLKKKCHNSVNHTSRESGPGGWPGGWGGGDPRQQLRTRVWKSLSLGSHTYSLGLHSGANAVQSLGLPSSTTEVLRLGWTGWVELCPWESPLRGPLQVTVSLSHSAAGQRCGEGFLSLCCPPILGLPVSFMASRRTSSCALERAGWPG